MQIGALALEERMRADGEENIEVAGGTTAHARLPFARQPDAGTVLDAGGNVDGERALARHPPRSRAGRTGIVDDLAAALAARTGPLEREETLSVADASLAAAGRAGLGTGTGLGAGAGAGLAGHRGRDAHLRGLAGIGLVQTDLHVVAQIGAALAAAAASAPTAAAHAEEIVENVREGGGHVAKAAGGARTAAVLEGGMAEAVIGRALVLVLEDFIGLVDLLEADLAALVAGVAIGVPLHGELAEGGLQRAVVGGALDAQDLVVAALGHSRVPPRHFCRRVIAELYLVIHDASQKTHPRACGRRG